MTTLTYGATVLNLPDDLLWTDEFTWSPVQAAQTYSVAGALLIDRGVKLTGRPMTLQGGPDWAWMTRATALTLRTWAGIAGATFTLVYRGVTYSALQFDHAGTPLEVVQIADYFDPDSTDVCYAVLRLISTG